MIEILIALLVIGTLSAAGFSGTRSISKWIAISKTNDLFAGLEIAFRQYKVDHGHWPDDFGRGEIRLNQVAGDWRVALAPYFVGDLLHAELMDGFGNEDIRIIFDRNGDNYISSDEFPAASEGLPETGIRKPVAIFSLDRSGSVAGRNWDG